MWTSAAEYVTIALPVSHLVDHSMSDLWISVKVHPGAGKDIMIQHAPGRLEAWVRAKPVQGEATAALVGLLARTFAVSPGSIRLVKGRSGRHKVFRIRTSHGATG